MKITDINCMMGFCPSKRECYRELEDLYQEMDRLRISDCIAYHSAALWSPRRGNALIKQLADNSSGRVKPCYVLGPNLGSSEMPDQYELLKQLRAEKPAAVKLYPNANGYRLDDFYCGELLEVLSELAMPVFFDASQAPGFDYLPSLAKTHPKIKFIILRHGFRESRYIVPLIKKTDNIYFDTSIMVDAGLIEEIVLKYGSEKLLFGSGLPSFVPTGALSLIIYARIKDQDKENILSNNWLRIQGGILCK